jgi:hypothetical protein
MESFVAYIGKPQRNGMGCDRIYGQHWDVTDWNGNKLCSATRGATWRVNSYIGDTMSQWYCIRAGREYTGRGFGQGMSIVFRETAASVKARANANP